MKKNILSILALVFLASFSVSAQTAAQVEKILTSKAWNLDIDGMRADFDAKYANFNNLSAAERSALAAAKQEEAALLHIMEGVQMVYRANKSGGMLIMNSEQATFQWSVSKDGKTLISQEQSGTTQYSILEISENTILLKNKADGSETRLMAPGFKIPRESKAIVSADGKKMEQDIVYKALNIGDNPPLTNAKIKIEGGKIYIQERRNSGFWDNECEINMVDGYQTGFCKREISTSNTYYVRDPNNGRILMGEWNGFGNFVLTKLFATSEQDLNLSITDELPSLEKMSEVLTKIASKK